MLHTSCPKLRLHFNPRPPWGGRQSEMFKILEIMGISIHALRGEGDGGEKGGIHTLSGISIHALRGEGDFLAAQGIDNIF